MQKNIDKAYLLLKQLYGENSKFREGQLDAIKETLKNHRTLIVQKTGWGKSLVYFICTKILREQNRGVTLVVSPLLVLMENQIDAAKKLGLNCDVLNSTTTDRRENIIQNMIRDQLDLVLVTPETLFRDDIQEAIKHIKIGLLVIDEAHCISDWGHDFRLEYGNLNRFIKLLPQNVPILATTATANDRVIEDLKNQFGGDVFVSRGGLTRDSLVIQVLNLNSRVDRYTWILKNINKLKGTGIIYCLTQRDCDYLSDFLNKNGVNVLSYYSRKDEEPNCIALNKFQNNQIKAIVATIKLGMGYDKGDIGFVIHFQQPSNIVSYYQQIGRAGRNIDRAEVFLMSGKEDEDIIDYFIDTAFPTREECEVIYSIIDNNFGIGYRAIISKANFRENRISKTIYFLINEGAIRKDGVKYYSTPNQYNYNQTHYNSVTEIRKKEKRQMYDLIKTKDCYSKFIANALDDFSAPNCNKCSNCLEQEIMSTGLSLEEKEKALEYLNNLSFDIEPRKRWATTSLTNQTAIQFINQKGIALSKYGDAGYGELVKKDKYKNEKFSDELVGKSTQVLKSLVKEHNIKHLTFVPSLRSRIVEDFANKLAQNLKLEFVSALKKTDARAQKLMENSSFQCYNALSSFEALDIDMPKKFILVDDMVDSKWTLTVCGFKLMEKGAEMIFPFALADSSFQEDK